MGPLSDPLIFHSFLIMAMKALLGPVMAGLVLPSSGLPLPDPIPQGPAEDAAPLGLPTLSPHSFLVKALAAHC